MKEEKFNFNEIVNDISNFGIKIPKSNYLSKGNIPIIDQGKEIIAGFSDLDNGNYPTGEYIIFGDHTRMFKYVDYPFFKGADGVKVLKVKNRNIIPKYIYYHLLNTEIPNTGYNRHFKWLKEISFRIPDQGTQFLRVRILDQINKLINQQKKRLDLLDQLNKSRVIREVI